MEENIEEFIKGNKKAFDGVYQKYSPSMFGICMRYANCRDDAQEILQETFIKVYENREKANPELPLGPWIKTITIRTAINFLKAQKRMVLTENEDFFESKPELFVSESDAKDAQTALLKLLTEMPAGYRTVFNLFVLDNLTHKEIAEYLEITEGTSKSQLAKAKNWIRINFEKKEAMKELDEIDQLFQTTFEGFEQTPDQSVKTNIDRAIASKKKRRRFLFILFPILVGSSILAATSYFHPGSGKPTPERNSIAQNPLTKETQATPFSEINKQEKRETTPQTASISDKNQTGSIRTNQFQAKTSHPKNAPVRTNFNSHSTIKNTLPANGQSSSSNLKPDLNESENQSTELTPAIAKTDDPIRDKSDSTIAQINNQDSLTASTSVDSSATKELVTAVDKPDLLLEPTKAHSKWSLSLLTGWENESKKPAERFDSTEFSGASEEYARIQSTSFYGKIELNRRISDRIGFLFGLGFHSRRITQTGSLYSLDSFPLVENVSSTPPDTFGYFIRQQNESRISRVNSVILPLGIAYSVPLGNVFRFRISGGTELAYSWITEIQSAPHLSTPKFNAFGWNVWLRPEIHYTFGKCQLFGFGSINQPLLQQLKWDFSVRRNPAFGAGIGLLIHL